jgi:3-oxoacyl-[acyl-carrier protein] reductase
MNLQLTNKIALVTGASMGIGNAIARGLAAEGVQLCIVARRRNLLEQLSETIVSAGGLKPELIDIDLMQQDASEKLSKAALQLMGHVDILINAAGGSRLGIPIDADENEWGEMMDLNFVRIRQLTHRIVPGMIERKWGRVINITGKLEPSITTKGFLAATPAKAAMHAWSKELSRQVGRHGVTVNCVAPANIMSEQIRRKYSEEFRKTMSERESSVGRYGEPEELAFLATCIASPLSAYITGTVMHVDGGLRRYAF